MTNPTNNAAGGQQFVQILSDSQDTSGSYQWQPFEGDEAIALRNYLTIPPQGKTDLVKASLDILSKCINPLIPSEHNTGIVIGHVQSGKTMSFTCVTTLARDNHYQLVIVITGTSIPLFDQSSKRLEKDLRVNTRNDRKW